MEDILANHELPEERFTNSFLYVTKGTQITTPPNEMQNKTEILANHELPENRFTNSFLYVTKSTLVKTNPNEMQNKTELNSKMESFAENSMRKTTQVESSSSHSIGTDIMITPSIITEPQSTSMLMVTTQSATTVPADLTQSNIIDITTAESTKMVSGSTMLVTESSIMLNSKEDKSLTLMITTPENVNGYGTTESKDISLPLKDLMTTIVVPHTESSNAIDTTVSEKPKIVIEMTTEPNVESQKTTMTLAAAVKVENEIKTTVLPTVQTIKILPSTEDKTQETTEVVLAAHSSIQNPTMVTAVPTAAKNEKETTAATSEMDRSVTAVPVPSSGAHTDATSGMSTTMMLTQSSNKQQSTMPVKPTLTSLPQLVPDETTPEVEIIKLATSTERKLASTMQHTEVSIMNTRSSADGSTMRMTTHSPVSGTTKRTSEKMSNGNKKGSGSSNLSASAVAIVASIVFLCIANRSLVSTFYEICVLKM